jgi:hypothetical protein
VGTPKPLAVLDPHGAVSGVAIVTGQLGRTVGMAALVAEWAKGEVQRVQLGTPVRAGTVKPFLTGFKNPVPVMMSPDGSLLVGDWSTGTIYRITDQLSRDTRRTPPVAVSTECRRDFPVVSRATRTPAACTCPTTAPHAQRRTVSCRSGGAAPQRRAARTMATGPVRRCR